MRTLHARLLSPFIYTIESASRFHRELCDVHVDSYQAEDVEVWPRFLPRVH